MQRIYQALPIILLAFGLNACTKGFEDMNQNPNESEVVDPQFLLSTVTIATAYDYQKEAYWDKPASAGRYITLVRNEGDDKFDWGPQSWDGFYSKLSTNKNMMDMAAASGEKQYVALGKILKAFNFAYVTDLYGDAIYRCAEVQRRQ